MTLRLDDVQARIYDLSFDPYHCAEMRWGASSNHAQEMASCASGDAAHLQRFSDERRMRNVIDRPPPGTPTPLDSGPDAPEDVDVPALLARLGVKELGALLDLFDQEAHTRGTPSSLAKTSALASVRLWIPTTATPGIPPNARTCSRAMAPAPMTATCMVMLPPP